MEDGLQHASGNAPGFVGYGEAIVVLFRPRIDVRDFEAFGHGIAVPDQPPEQARERSLHRKSPIRCFHKGNGLSLSHRVRYFRHISQNSCRRAVDDPFFSEACDDAGNAWTLRAFTDRAFYPALEAAGIDNPIVEVAGGVKRHKYTPHSCRHTFATLAKRIKAPEKDMLELIGHTGISMTRYYQDVDLDDLRKITDAL